MNELTLIADFVKVGLKKIKPLPELTQEQIERFWGKVDKNGPLPDQNNIHYNGLDRCWLWVAYKNKAGYGYVGINNQMYYSHRISKNLFQPFDSSLHALHHCDNRLCVNPFHIFLGDCKINLRDRDNKGRANPRRGSKHWNSKLTEENIVDIHRLRSSGFLLKEVAKKFGVSLATIGYIIQNKTWKHVI